MWRNMWYTYDNNILKKNESYDPFCPNQPLHVRCHEDHSVCFPRYQACVYDFDVERKMASCTDGQHLQQCTHIQCPNMFKCPASYCIPFHKVCNGIKDCLDGSDEHICYHSKAYSARQGILYSSFRSSTISMVCPGYLKCREDNICVDQDKVCDGIVQCPESEDDEVMCASFTCPKGCRCVGDAVIICVNLGITTVPVIGFHPQAVKLLSLSNNTINITSLNIFKYTYLGRLDLDGNHLFKLPILFGLQQLYELNLEYNQFHTLSSRMFDGLTHLQVLRLRGNQIKTIENHAFIGLMKLPHLDLSAMRISSIHFYAFQGLHSLSKLNLTSNQINEVTSELFSPVKNLEYLELDRNPLEQFEENTFKNMHDLDIVKMPAYKFCCFAGNHTKCYPESDEFSSCSDLMSSRILQVAIWCLGLLSLCGNLLVIVWRILSKSQSAKSTAGLVINLALSDMLMGLYLIIIASADSYFRGKYILEQENWMKSGMCKFAGFISALSSEMSVYMLTLITAERLITFLNPFSERPISGRKTLILIGVGWATFSILCMIPIVGKPYFRENFIKNGVCLLFNITAGMQKGWWYSTFFFLTFNLISFVFVFISYISIYIHIQRSRHESRRELSQADIDLAKRFALIIITDFVCWMPIIITNYVSLGGVKVNLQVSAWMAVFLLSLNSAINPLLYTFTSSRKKDLLKDLSCLSSKGLNYSSCLSTKNSHVPSTSNGIHQPSLNMCHN